MINTAARGAGGVHRDVLTGAPVAHRTRTGWFDVGLTDDLVIFSLSAQGLTALELGVPLAEAKGAMN